MIISTDVIQLTLTLKICDYRTGFRNVSHCQQQQSYSGLRSPGRSYSTYLWDFILIDVYGINHIRTAETKSSEEWSSQLWTQFIQLSKEHEKNSGLQWDWTRDFAMPVRCSKQLSWAVFICSGERDECGRCIWKKSYKKCGNEIKWRIMRVSMGLIDRRNSAKNLVDSRKIWKILTVSRKYYKKELTVKEIVP